MYYEDSFQGARRLLVFNPQETATYRSLDRFE